MMFAKALLWLKSNWLLALVLALVAFGGYRIYVAELSAATLRTTVSELSGERDQLKRDVADAVSAANSANTANKVLAEQQQVLATQTAELLKLSGTNQQTLATAQQTLAQLKKENDHVAAYLGSIMPDPVYDVVFRGAPDPLGGRAEGALRDPANGDAFDGLPLSDAATEGVHY